MAEVYANDFHTTVVGAVSGVTDPVTITLNAPPPVALQGGNWRARIDNELLLVTLVSGSDITATRAIEGTTKTSHLNGASFDHIWTAESITLIPEYAQLGGYNRYSGNLALPQVSKVADYAATTDDYAIFVDASTGPVTITLPTSIGNGGIKYLVKKIDQTQYPVIIEGTSGQTFDGELDIRMTDPWTAIEVLSNDANWYII